MNKQEFLDKVTDQISYRPLRPEIRRELEEHMEDRAAEYEAQGLSSQEAEQRAVEAMGDAVSIGVQINAVRHLQKSPVLIFLTIALLFSGCAASAYMFWLPEQSANGFLYYVPGAAVFLITVYWGYPLFIRFRKPIALVIGAVLGALMLIRMLLCAGFITIWGMSPSFYYFSLLSAALLFPLSLYGICRRSPLRFFLASAGFAFLCLACYPLNPFNLGSACLIASMAAAGTGIFMMARGKLSLTGISHSLREKGITGLLFLAGIGLLVGSNFLSPGQRHGWNYFLHPEKNIVSKWDDTYNSVLIKELLSRTPALGGISLTPEEMMAYGTGEWYFAERDPEQISLVRSDYPDEESFEQAWKASSTFRGIVYYNETNVTLYDILPQHYHNNYLISLLIFQYGWIPGLLFLGLIGGYYLCLFSRIGKIRQPLASSLAFCCGLLLLGQTLLYVLGNFGFQYHAFPVLPLLSEGRVSIMVNMFFLGFIFSAYRYDRVSGFFTHVFTEALPWQP